MRATAFCLLALLAAASIADARDLLQESTSTSCVSEAVTTLNLMGSGSGRAKADSFCEAEATAKSAIFDVLDVYFTSVVDDSGAACTRASAEESVTGIATAVATAYSSVAVEVEIVGTGDACASGFAGGDAFAVSVVDIMLDLSVELIEANFPGEGYSEPVADVGKTTLASGRATGNAVAVIIADAWTAAAAAACQDGTGIASDFQASFVESVTTAIASLWANVVAELCSNFDDADTEGLEAWQMETSSSTSEILGGIDVTQSTIAVSTDGAVGGGSTSEATVCDGDKLARCCTEKAKLAKTCACGRGCLLSEVTSEGGATGIKTWIDTAKASCTCPKA